jgi:hypothetical protein
MARPNKAERAAEKRIEAAYYRRCRGVQVDIMDISKIFTVGHRAIASGATEAELEAAIVAFVETIRKN